MALAVSALMRGWHGESPTKEGAYGTGNWL